MEELQKTETDYEEIPVSQDAPVSQTTEVPDTSDIAMECRASGWLRFFGYVIDIACYYAFVYAAGMVLGIYAYANYIELPSEDSPFYTIFAFGLMFVFYLFFEALFKMTPGKMLLGMKVVNPDGSAPNFSTILIRSLCRLIPFDPISYFSNEEGCWHGSISETFVVSRSELRDAKSARGIS